MSTHVAVLRVRESFVLAANMGGTNVVRLIVSHDEAAAIAAALNSDAVARTAAALSASQVAETKLLHERADLRSELRTANERIDVLTHELAGVREEYDKYRSERLSAATAELAEANDSAEGARKAANEWLHRHDAVVAEREVAIAQRDASRASLQELAAAHDARADELRTARAEHARALRKRDEERDQRRECEAEIARLRAALDAAQTFSVQVADRELAALARERPDAASASLAAAAGEALAGLNAADQLEYYVAHYPTLRFAPEPLDPLIVPRAVAWLLRKELVR